MRNSLRDRGRAAAWLGGPRGTPGVGCRRPGRPAAHRPTSGWCTHRRSPTTTSRSRREIRSTAHSTRISARTSGSIHPRTASTSALARRRMTRKIRRACTRVTARGCTMPPLPNQEIIVKFTDPDGNAVYHTVKTDAKGCFEDFLVTVKEGTWKVTAEYGGHRCQAPVTTEPETVCWCPHR